MTERLLKGNIISDEVWKRVIKYMKEHQRVIPAGTTFFKYDGSSYVTDKETTTGPTYGLAYLNVIIADPETANHSGVLEICCIEKMDELERRGYSRKQAGNGEIE
jgi:hypothetical protein